jgi:hypothetical protein
MKRKRKEKEKKKEHQQKLRTPAGKKKKSREIFHGLLSSLGIRSRYCGSTPRKEKKRKEKKKKQEKKLCMHSRHWLSLFVCPVVSSADSRSPSHWQSLLTIGGTVSIFDERLIPLSPLFCFPAASMGLDAERREWRTGGCALVWEGGGGAASGDEGYPFQATREGAANRNRPFFSARADPTSESPML